MATMNFWENKRILVTGSSGFLGRYVVQNLREKRGVSNKQISAPTSAYSDLKIWRDCEHVTKNIDLVIHLAGNVGGIGYNQANPGALFYDNLIMGAQLMEAARQNGVSKFVVVGTVCSYPANTPVPFREEELWHGYPEPINAPYGIAKLALLAQAQAYRQQYGFNAIYLLPVNLYGVFDNFNPESAHVIPDIIHKCYAAKASGAPEIVIWGDGTPTREFLHVADAAEGIVRASECYDGAEPINLGGSDEISIASLAQMIAQMVGYRGRITWDTSRPNGQMRRKLDTTRAERFLAFHAQTKFEDGLWNMVKAYRP